MTYYSGSPDNTVETFSGDGYKINVNVYTGVASVYMDLLTIETDSSPISITAVCRYGLTNSLKEKFTYSDKEIKYSEHYGKDVKLNIEQYCFPWYNSSKTLTHYIYIDAEGNEHILYMGQDTTFTDGYYTYFTDTGIMQIEGIDRMKFSNYRLTEIYDDSGGGLFISFYNNKISRVTKKIAEQVVNI